MKNLMNNAYNYSYILNGLTFTSIFKSEFVRMKAYLQANFARKSFQNRRTSYAPLKIRRFFYGLMLTPHFTLFDPAKLSSHDTDTW